MTKDQFLDKILTKMFEIVGATYTKEFIAQKDWYLKYSWDEKQENEFKKYFIKEVKKRFRLRQKRAETEFLWFNLNYGWKRKDL